MNSATFQQTVENNPLPVVVDVWAPWCGPCRMVAPALDRLAKRYDGKVALVKVNADESPEVARALNIYSIPTLLVYWQGREQVRRIGALPENELAALFEAAQQQEAPTAPSMAFRERLFRLGSGAMLAALGVYINVWPLLLLGGFVMFLGVHDRCPIWQALAPRLRSLMGR